MNPSTVTGPGEALAGLKDIHLPAPPSWWPPAPGWWLAAGLVILLATLLARYLLRRRAAMKPVRLALAELEKIGLPAADEFEDPETRRKFLLEISTLLRRFCLLYHPNRQVAELYGRDWVAFLADVAPAAAREFFLAELAPLELVYAPERILRKASFDPRRLRNAAEKWLLEQKKSARRQAAGDGGRQ